MSTLSCAAQDFIKVQLEEIKRSMQNFILIKKNKITEFIWIETVS